MPNARRSLLAQRVNKALSSRFEQKRRTTRAIVTSVQKDGSGKITGVAATIDGLPSQVVQVDHGGNYAPGDVLLVENRGGAASPSWLSLRTISTTIPVPSLQFDPNLPTPTGLNATNTNDGVTANILIYWTTIDPMYGNVAYDVQVRLDDPSLYNQEFNVRDDKIETTLASTISSGRDVVPHTIYVQSDDIPPVGRILIDAELIDYTKVVMGAGDSGTGVGTLNLWTDSSKSWDDDEWIGWAIVDSAGWCRRILDSTATTLTISGTLASGTYTIYPAFSGITRGVGGTTAVSHYTAATIYLKTEFMRLISLPCASYNIRVRTHRMVDDTVSAWTSSIVEDATDSSAPGTPTGFTVSPNWKSIDFEWTGPTKATTPDLAGFEIYKATDEDGTGATLYVTTDVVLSHSEPEDVGTEGFFNIKAFDLSGNKSAYALATGSWAFGMACHPSQGQLLTNSDWELGDPSTDSIDEWDVTFSGIGPTLIEDYGDGYGLYGGRGIKVNAPTFGSSGDKTNIEVLWPLDTTARKILGIEDAVYCFSFYQAGGLGSDILAFLLAHDGAGDVDYLSWHSGLMEYGGKEEADGYWDRVWYYGKWNATDGSHIYIGVGLGTNDPSGMNGLVYFDRPQLELGPIPTPYGLVQEFAGSATLGLRLDNSGIISADLNVDNEGTLEKVVVSDGITAPSGESGKANVYVDTSDSVLKVRHGTGTPISLEEQGSTHDFGYSSNSGGNTTVGTSWTTVTSHTKIVGTGQLFYASASVTIYCSSWSSDDWFGIRLYDGTNAVYQRVTATNTGRYYTLSISWPFATTGSRTIYLQVIRNSTAIGGYVPQYYGQLTSQVIDV